MRKACEFCAMKSEEASGKAVFFLNNKGCVEGERNARQLLNQFDHHCEEVSLQNITTVGLVTAKREGTH